MKNLKMALLVLSGAMVFPSDAADYYVSSIRSGRSDSNAGTNPNAPWATFGKVISSWGSLSAGDTVHVERGSRWDLSFSSDYFNINNGGSASGGPITLRGDDYGTGSKPILRRTGGSGDCAFILIRRSYVTVRDMELDGGYSGYGKNTSGMLILADGRDMTQARILNMKIHNLGGNTTSYICGIWLASWTQNTTSDCLIEGNEVSDYAAHGLNHYSQGRMNNIIWRNNYVRNNFSGGRYPSANAALQITSGGQGCIFEHNWLEDTTTTEGNVLAFGKYAGDTGVNTIRFNLVAGSSKFGILFVIDQSGHRLLHDVYGNILLSNAGPGIAIHPYNSYGPGTRLNIYNNTFYNNCTAGGSDTRGSMEMHAYCANTTIDFANNLIFHRSYGSTVGLALASGFNGSFSHRNNLFWHEGGTGRNIITHNQIYTVANAKTYESTAQNTNPQFKNTGQLPTAVSYGTGPVPDGLSLQSSSPAIGAAANLGSTYALDITRAARIAPWTIGAYQAGSAPPPADTTPPTVSITAPAAGATVSGSAVPVSATASDNIGVVGVQFKLNGANLGAEDTSSPYSIVWDTTGSANGSASLTAVARDAAGNARTSAAVTVTVTNTPLPAGAIVSEAGIWKAQGFALQTGSFTAEFDAVPLAANIDVITGLSLGSASDYDALAAIVRFNNSGTIDVRNGDVYASATAVSYSPGVTYRFRMLLNVPSRTYSVYVKAGSSAEVLLAQNVAFRTSQATVTGLNTLSVTAVAGSHMVYGLSVSATIPPDTTAPTVSLTTPANGATVSGSAVTVSAAASDNIGVVGVQFKLNGAHLGAEDTSSPYSIVWDTTGASNGAASLTAVARDAAGNARTSAVVTVTVTNTLLPADAIVSEAGAWQNLSFPAESGLFEVKFEAIPQNIQVDCITGLSQGSAADFDDLAVLVRFNPSGRIDVRNGDVYAADSIITYTVGTSHRFRLLVDIPAHTYRVYVQIGDSPEILLARDYAFRTSQSTVSSLDALAVTAAAGSHIVFNFAGTQIHVAIPMPPAGLRIRER